MIIDKEQEEMLAKFCEDVIEFIEQTKKEKTNVGMKLWDKCQYWLIQLGK